MGKVKFGDESKGINDSKENKSEEEEDHIKEQTKLQCKSCNCFFPETSILKHLSSHKESCKKAYSNDEWQQLVDSSKSRKKILRKQRIARQRGFSADEEGEYEWLNKLKVQCKNCKVMFYDWTILKHLSHEEECKKTYSAEELAEYKKFSKDKRAFFDAKSKLIYDKQNKSVRKQKLAKKRNVAADEDDELIYLKRQCKNCKVMFYDHTILKHLSREESCKKTYSAKELAEHKKSSKRRKNFYENRSRATFNKQNQSSVSAKRKATYKKKKEIQKEKQRLKWDKEAEENSIKSLISTKEKFAEEARFFNKISYEGAKGDFEAEFQRFKDMSLSENNLQAIIKLEKSIEARHEDFEAAINESVKKSKEVTLVDTFKDAYNKLKEIYKPNDGDKIHDDWHKLSFEIDHQLNKIAIEMKKPYNWSQHCLCNSCISSKNINPKEVKKLKEQWKVQPSQMFYPV